MRELKTGETLKNKYQIIEIIGRGGMGTVYKARDLHSGEHIAIKTIPAEVCKSPEEMERMKENFSLVHKLKHPNIATTLALEYLDAENEYFLVMEYCKGVSLKAYRRKKGGKLPPAEAFRIGKQIASALDYSHSQPGAFRWGTPLGMGMLMKSQCMRCVWMIFILGSMR
ncbi:MAG: protein kinase [Nitrospinae bacterium]|nr:protein kinase [Nitrospinota bacterium]